ncbi:hypothetical protein GW17_00011956, partial [Ensete ventricosum]
VKIAIVGKYTGLSDSYLSVLKVIIFGIISNILELLTHPYFVGVQFHPEYKSRPGKPSAPFLGNDLPGSFHTINP